MVQQKASLTKWSNDSPLERTANLRDLSIYHISKDIVISNNPKRLQTIKTMYEKMLNSSLDVRRLPGLLFQTIFEPFENNALLNTISDSYKSLSM